ncbi:hypothetical protein Sphch_3296 [Sphingobium chlorophenolicum L-1]|uniref:Uncharacterized protein n=1 Tax=Sphingobium chlorophenolicum L-1 TaxID=690566 RepID=F6F386_SPHCR|nr:hypothetical protein Sphch_3296 [Sphingobium chlorophenolicum L-1]
MAGYALTGMYGGGPFEYIDILNQWIESGFENDTVPTYDREMINIIDNGAELRLHVERMDLWIAGFDKEAENPLCKREPLGH